MRKIGLAMLVYNRPVHTGLALAYALAGKSVNTELHVFYSIHRTAKPVSSALDSMLKALVELGAIQLHYIADCYKQDCGGNVDTLMTTMTSTSDLSCFIKIDDDVLIGPGTDALMASMLLELEKDGVYLLMAQPVHEHMRGPKPFIFETTCKNHRIVQRMHNACPMETYTAVNPKFLGRLRDAGLSTSCDDRKGTYMPFVRKLGHVGLRAGLVLTPPVPMQHIGLSSTIENGVDRSWAPARTWEPPHRPVEVPEFNFVEWEASHKTGRQKEFAIETIQRLAYSTAAESIIDSLTAYTPEKDIRKLPVNTPAAQVITKPKPIMTRRVIIKPTQVRPEFLRK